MSYGNGASTTYGNGARIEYPNGASASFGNGASIGFSNGASVQFPNGAPSATLQSGAQVVLPLGGQVTFLSAATVEANNTSVGYTANQTITYTQGATLRFTNGASIKLPNGADLRFPNGATVGFPNGATVGFPNGATLNLPNGASATYPSGGSVVVNGYSTQAFLTSRLMLYPIGNYRLDPATWQSGDTASGDTDYQDYQKALYKYMQGALMKQNGDLPAGSFVNDPWVKGDYDTYDLVAFKYLIRAAAKDTTSFTLSYQRTDGTTVSQVFQGGLGLCELGTSDDWVLTLGNHNQLAQPYQYLAGCGSWVSAAIGLFTQPIGINNSVSIRNVAVGDHPAAGSSNVNTNNSNALDLVSLLRPLPKKRAVALDPFAVGDNRDLDAAKMSVTGNSGVYSATLNTQGGWAGGYVIRCTGGDPVVMNLNRLKGASAVVPGTSIQQGATNLALRVCKGVHGCNGNDMDFVLQSDDYSVSDVWPQASFTCGAGYSEVAVADYTKYRFVYNWQVRSKDGNDAVSNGIATLCSKAPESTCRATTSNPTIATTNTVPASEVQVYTQREGLYFGDDFPWHYFTAGSTGFEHWVPMNSSFGLSFNPVQLSNETTAASVLYGNCDVRSVDPILYGPGLPEPPRVTWSPSASSFPGMTWPTSYRVLNHRPVSSDRSQYRHEFCTSLVQDKCIPCVQSNTYPSSSREGYLPVLANGSWMPVNYDLEPWLSVAKDPNWSEQPQYAGEAVSVEASYYNATRVCAQQYDRGSQGYCFTDWQDQSSCSSDTGTFYCKSANYRNTTGAQRWTSMVLVLWLPQGIQPILTANAGRCPVGYAKGTKTGFTSRCFAAQANGASCSVDDQCSSRSCECNDASCTARTCTSATAPVCRFCTGTSCTTTGYLAAGVKDPQECETTLACSGAGSCR